MAEADTGGLSCCVLLLPCGHRSHWCSLLYPFTAGSGSWPRNSSSLSRARLAPEAVPQDSALRRKLDCLPHKMCGLFLRHAGAWCPAPWIRFNIAVRMSQSTRLLGWIRTRFAERCVCVCACVRPCVGACLCARLCVCVLVCVCVCV